MPLLWLALAIRVTLAEVGSIRGSGNSIPVVPPLGHGMAAVVTLFLWLFVDVLPAVGWYG